MTEKLLELILSELYVSAEEAGSSELSYCYDPSLLPRFPLFFFLFFLNSGHPLRHTFTSPHPASTARLLTPAQVFPILSHSPSRPNTNIVLRQRTLGSVRRLLTSHWAHVYLHA